MTRALPGIPGWLAYTVLMLPCILVGLVLVPMLCLIDAMGRHFLRKDHG